MPAPEFHTYARKLQLASRRADADATPAQREAGNARVGTLHVHGLKISIEYPKGAVRRGCSPDGKEWSRVVQNPYGYVRGTDGGDGEHLDVWVGDHPDSQMAFLVTFLTSDGDHDEWKLVLGVKHLNEAKDLLRKNYPPNFVETRVGEIRGMFLPDLKKLLKQKGVMKTASCGFFCKQCQEFYKGRFEEDGCPTCSPTKEAAGKPGLLGALGSLLPKGPIKPFTPPVFKPPVFKPPVFKPPVYTPTIRPAGVPPPAPTLPKPINIPTPPPPGLLEKAKAVLPTPQAAAQTAKAVVKAPATAAKAYTAEMAGYGPNGPLAGQRLFDSTSVKPKLTPRAYNTAVAGGQTRAQLEATHQIPGFAARLPIIREVAGPIGQWGNAVNRNKYLHPFAQSYNTVSNVLATPMTRPISKPVAKYLSARGKKNVAAGGWANTALGRTQQATAGALNTVDAAMGPISSYTNRAALIGGGYGMYEHAKRTPANQAKSILASIPGVYTDDIEGNPEVQNLKNNPFSSYLQGATDQSELAQTVRAVSRRSMPYNVANAADNMLTHNLNDPLAQGLGYLRSFTPGGMLSNQAIRSVADKTPAPTAQILREEVTARAPKIMENYDQEIDSPIGQRMTRLLGPVTKSIGPTREVMYQNRMKFAPSGLTHTRTLGGTSYAYDPNWQQSGNLTTYGHTGDEIWGHPEFRKLREHVYLGQENFDLDRFLHNPAVRQLAVDPRLAGPRAQVVDAATQYNVDGKADAAAGKAFTAATSAAKTLRPDAEQALQTPSQTVDSSHGLRNLMWDHLPGQLALSDLHATKPLVPNKLTSEAYPAELKQQTAKRIEEINAYLTDMRLRAAANTAAQPTPEGAGGVAKAYRPELTDLFRKATDRVVTPGLVGAAVDVMHPRATNQTPLEQWAANRQREARIVLYGAAAKQTLPHLLTSDPVIDAATGKVDQTGLIRVRDTAARVLEDQLRRRAAKAIGR